MVDSTMIGSTNSILSKVLLFVSIILVCITSNASDLQPKFKVENLQNTQSSYNDSQQKETTISKTVTIPLNSQNRKDIPVPPIPNKEPPAPEPNLGTIMEGGGTISTHIPANNFDETETEVYDSEHTKGSKGRKGVDNKQSSVVPRKGVLDTDQSLTNGSVAISKDENNNPALTLGPAIGTSSQQSVKDKGSIKHTGNIEQQSKIYSTKRKQLLEDPDDDFDKYPWIKSSTTGEDYVIIGIVIIIGIWISVFGALIFYRRAGEYWDRRHYRRMDFLVEGMYND